MMSDDRSQSGNSAAATAQLAKDPVCGMSVNPATAKHTHEDGGKKYYFCAGSCAEKFRVDPQKYLKAPADAAHRVSLRAAPKSVAVSAPDYVCPMCREVREAKPGACPSCGMALEPEMPLAATRTEYTCPMHPQIVRSEPGSCPICGMALEPRTITAAQEENPELRDMTRRFWISLALTAPLMAIAMSAMFGFRAFTLDSFVIHLHLPQLEFLLATPVVLWGGLPFFQRFWT